MSMDAAVREFLRERGCPELVVQGGLRRLVERWAKTVDEIEAGYSLGLDDYLNDMDGRQIMAEVLEAVQVPSWSRLRARIAEADARVRRFLKPAKRCLWSDNTAHERGWTPGRQWWYFERPDTAGADLLEDLERRGL